jgi:hypothetical protein
MVQFPSAFAAPAYPFCGRVVCGRYAGGVAVSGFRHLRRRSAVWLHRSHVFGFGDMGGHAGKGASASHSAVLADLWESWEDLPASLEKNFGFCKNFVCNSGKMGYNKME